MNTTKYVLVIISLSISLPGLSNSIAEVTWSKDQVVIGERVTLSIYLKNLPEVYGVQFSSSFNPSTLQAVSKDNNTSIHHIPDSGIFDDPSAFSIKNDIDEKNGKIEYIKTLVKPAAAPSGDGVLLNMDFLAIEEGQVNFGISTLKLGTQDGKSIIPEIKSKHAFPIVTKQSDTSYTRKVVLTGIFIIAIILATTTFTRRRKRGTSQVIA